MTSNFFAFPVEAHFEIIDTEFHYFNAKYYRSENDGLPLKLYRHLPNGRIA